MTGVDAPWVGRALLRREDRRLLTGAGQFTADLELPRMLHVAFVRSPLAHARIRGVLGDIAAVGDDHCDCLADKPHHVVRQQGLLRVEEAVLNRRGPFARKR